MLAIIGMLVQLPFLISGALIGPHPMLPIGERFELFLIKVSQWSRWPYAPASVVVLHEMFRADAPWWVIVVIGVIDGFLLGAFWNAGRRALEGFEEVEEEENTDV